MTKKAYEELHGNPSRLLNKVARLIIRDFDRRLTPLGVNVTNLVVLGALQGSEHLSQKELTELGDIGQPAMAQMLDRLVKQGLVVRAPDSVDRRKVMFTLSKTGIDLMPKVSDHIVAGNSEIFSVLSREELDTLLRLLKTLEIHVETRGEPGSIGP